MENKLKPKLHISLSREHNKYQPDVAKAFDDLDVSFDGGVMRFSAEEMAMQVMIAIGTGVVSSAVWDAIKVGIKNLHKQFNTVHITFRDSEFIMYTVKSDSSVSVLVVPDRIKEFAHIKTIDDLVVHLQKEKLESFEWQSKTLGDLLNKLEGGGTPSKENPDYWNGTIPWASVKDVVTHNPNDTQDHISELGLKHSSSRLVSKGTLIVPTRMALGHAVVFDVDVAINQDLKALYPKKSLLNQYLFHWFKSKKTFIERLGSGSTVSGIQQNELKRIKFDLPPLSEQNRIVLVLDTWDKSIEKLEQKIQVKKKVKKGLMQDLLTGKRLLIGFNDEWEIRKLRDCLTIKHGKPQKEVESPDGEYPILGTGGEFGRSTKFLYDKPSVLIGRKGTIDKPKYIDTPFWTVDTLFYSEIKKNYSPKFLYYVFLTVNWKLYNEGSGVPSLSASTISSIKIKVPKEKKEQEAIAHILTTADKEITELEKKLSILKEQKRYLLSNLITGIIRTPETLSAKITSQTYDIR